MSVSLRRLLLNFVSGILIVAAALFIYVPTASAGNYNHPYMNYYHPYRGHISELCVDSPQHQCFLLVDFVHNCPFPFFLMMDQGFWYHGHYYQYYHRYYTYDGPYYHTYYYYTY